MHRRERDYTTIFLRLSLAGLFLLPLMWAALAALRPAGLPLSAPLLSARPTLTAFTRLFAVLPVWRFTVNSLVVVLVAVPLTLLTASWAGFGMALLPRASQRRWVILSLLILMVPGVALWPARFLLYGWIGLIDSPAALVLPAIMGSSPFFVLMFYRAFRRIPSVIYDAARLDGAGILSLWWRVALPMARPTVVAVGLLAFFLYWGDFLSPLLYLRDSNRYTLPVGLQLLEQLGRSDYALLMAGALWAMAVPVILLFVVMLALAQRQMNSPQPDSGTAHPRRSGASP